MTFAGHAIGTKELGHTTAPTRQTFPGFRTLDAPIADLNIASPILQLFEITTAGGETTRVVDFGDLEASATPGQVTFDGDEYTSIKVSRSEISESTDGSFPEITITVLDPARDIADWVEANDGLRGAEVDLHIIEYKDIATAALAVTRSFRVARVTALEGPASISVTLSAPVLKDFRFPRIYFNRIRCFNAYHLRFIHDDRNFCNGGSDEFEDQTKQNVYTASDLATALSHGWSVRNGNQLGFGATAQSGESGTDKCLYLSASNVVSDYLWEDAARDGTFFYREITDDTDVDISVKVNPYLGSTDESICGILVQSQADPTSWVFWGVQRTAGGSRHLYRETVSGTSTDTTYTGTEASYRLKRSGSGWTAYVRDDSKLVRTLEAGSWTSKHTDTLDLGTGGLNVGVVMALDTTGAAGTLLLSYDVYHFRFLAGGFTDCDRSKTHCLERGNVIQFNAFEGMPDSVRSF